MASISPLAVSALPTTAPASDFKVNTAWTADATTNSTTAITAAGTTAYTKYTASIDDINVTAEFVENSARDAGSSYLPDGDNQAFRFNYTKMV